MFAKKKGEKTNVHFICKRQIEGVDRKGRSTWLEYLFLKTKDGITLTVWGKAEIEFILLCILVGVQLN